MATTSPDNDYKSRLAKSLPGETLMVIAFIQSAMSSGVNRYAFVFIGIFGAMGITLFFKYFATGSKTRY